MIGEKVSYRLAQRPGSYVILKYVRPVIKLRADQALSCPPAPGRVLDGCRADVSFIAGMITDKFAYHQPLYRQHVKLQDSGINVSRAWITKLMPAAVSLVEPIFNAQLESVWTCCSVSASIRPYSFISSRRCLRTIRCGPTYMTLAGYGHAAPGDRLPAGEGNK